MKVKKRSSIGATSRNSIKKKKSNLNDVSAYKSYREIIEPEKKIVKNPVLKN